MVCMIAPRMLQYNKLSCRQKPRLARSVACPILVVPYTERKDKIRRDGRGVSATTKQFLHLFLDNFSTTNGTFLERCHCFGFLNRQLIHGCGSGRYTVINTTQELVSLYAHTLWSGPCASL